MGYRAIAGLDEAGRGPLAGPVVAASVILPKPEVIPGVDDSKRLSADRRFSLFDEILRCARSTGIGLARCYEIDEINILEATRLAMIRAVQKMTVAPDFLLLDALSIPKLAIPQQPIIKGDQLSHSISAASILAKVIRDRIMIFWDKKYPQYGWKYNMGYGTQDHMEALKRFGPSPIHRKTFRGVCNCRGLFDSLSDPATPGQDLEKTR